MTTQSSPSTSWLDQTIALFSEKLEQAKATQKMVQSFIQASGGLDAVIKQWSPVLKQQVEEAVTQRLSQSTEIFDALCKEFTVAPDVLVLLLILDLVADQDPAVVLGIHRKVGPKLRTLADKNRAFIMTARLSGVGFKTWLRLITTNDDLQTLLLWVQSGDAKVIEPLVTILDEVERDTSVPRLGLHPVQIFKSIWVRLDDEQKTKLATAVEDNWLPASAELKSYLQERLQTHPAEKSLFPSLA